MNYFLWKLRCDENQKKKFNLITTTHSQLYPIILILIDLNSISIQYQFNINLIPINFNSIIQYRFILNFNFVFSKLSVILISCKRKCLILKLYQMESN